MFTFLTKIRKINIVVLQVAKMDAEGFYVFPELNGLLKFDVYYVSYYSLIS